MGEEPTPRLPQVGRGAGVSPPNRFERTHLEDDWEQLPADDDLMGRRKIATEFLPDGSKTVITENDSPDIPFRYSINPYRGCEHGCAYCYARPYHEMLGMNAGLDSESKIVVKFDAAALLREELCHPGWKGDAIALSGVTDCYQPAERKFCITRGLLEVMLEAQQATTITTKNALILRDLDLLAPMATMGLVSVNISIATLDSELARELEPRTSTPLARLRAVRELSEAGVPICVLIAPIIPGLTDHQIANVLQAAAAAGAVSAGCELLRLPLSVAPIFLDWLDTHRPLGRTKVEELIRATRDGRLNDSKFGERLVGSGTYAESISSSFAAFSRKCGLDSPVPELDTSRFRPPRSKNGQMRLF